MPELTARRIETTKPHPTRDRIIWDGDGLGFKVAASGSRSFVYRYSYAGRRRTMTLGPYPVLGLAQAREERQRQHAVLLGGKDPILARQTAAQAKVDGVRVREAIELYHDHYLAHEFKDPGQAVALLRHNLNPEIGDILVGDVEAPLMTAAINKVVGRGSKTTANRLLSRARHFFEWCQQNHYRGNEQPNPVTLTRKNAGGQEKPKSTNLDWNHIKDFMDLLAREDCGMTQVSREALLLVLATAKRPAEVATMAWSEVDLEAGTWRNPKEKTKSGIDDHLVFLNAFAVRVLRRMWEISGHTPWVFLSTQANSDNPKPLTRHSLSRAILRLHNEGRVPLKFTPHDMRRTFSTRMAGMEVPAHVVEKILHHKMEGVMAVYNKATYYRARRAAMDLWGQKLDAIERGESVTGD